MLLLCSPMLAVCWPMSGLCWPTLPLSYPYLAAMLTLCWPKLTLCCPMLTLCWPKVPLSCLYVDPMFTYVSLGNALPHSSDRNGGGGNGVTTGSPQVTPSWGGGWGGSPYNLRLPTEGLRQGHGLWPAPGFKG